MGQLNYTSDKHPAYPASKEGIKMNQTAVLFLACILAGFALIKMPAISFLASLSSFFHVIGALAILIFAFAILYYGVKALIKSR
jgi:amino acid transporter